MYIFDVTLGNQFWRSILYIPFKHHFWTYLMTAIMLKPLKVASWGTRYHNNTQTTTDGHRNLKTESALNVISKQSKLLDQLSPIATVFWQGLANKQHSYALDLDLPPSLAKVFVRCVNQLALPN